MFLKIYLFPVLFYNLIVLIKKVIQWQTLNKKKSNKKNSF